MKHRLKPSSSDPGYYESLIIIFDAHEFGLMGYTPSLHLYAQVDLDMYCGNRYADACFFPDDSSVLYSGYKEFPWEPDAPGSTWTN